MMDFPKLQALTEGIEKVKTIKKVATYRQKAVTKALMAKLEKHAPDFDVTVTYGKPFDDRNEGMMQTIRVEGTRAQIKAFVKKTGLVMNDESLHEGKKSDDEQVEVEFEIDAATGEAGEGKKSTKTDAPTVDKAAVLSFLKSCDAKCRADVKKKLDKMVAADEADE